MRSAPGALGAALLVALATACRPSPPRGGERGPCFGNHTCDSGLVCLSDLCVRPAPAAGSGPTTPVATGPAGLPAPCRDYLDLLDGYATCRAFAPDVRAELAAAFARMRASWASLGAITWPQASIDACLAGARAIRTAQAELGC